MEFVLFLAAEQQCWGLKVSFYSLPERTQEGLVQLACPHQGVDSLERDSELLQRSAMKKKETHTTGGYYLSIFSAEFKCRVRNILNAQPTGKLTQVDRCRGCRICTAVEQDGHE